MDHLRYQYLDAGTLRLMDILKDIRAAVEDPRVSALAVNLSGLRIRAEHAWEIREELKRARAAGKQVLIFIDRVQMTGYHLASVADRVALDPQGSIMLQGYALNRTYFKGTLEKLGLGFQELRFFKYKSFAEALSRESMSEAEREQPLNSSGMNGLSSPFETNSSAVNDAMSMSAVDFAYIRWRIWPGCTTSNVP